MSESYNKMMDAINKSQAFVIKYVWVAIILLILFVTWYYRKQLNKKEDNNTAMEIIYNKPDFFPKISSIQKNDAQFIFNNDKGTGHVRDYYIASSYNSCCGGDFQDDYVSLTPLKEVIFHGARLLDFEVYSVNDELVVAASGSASPYLKGTYNSIPLGGDSGVFQTIASHAFSNGTCSNPLDPLFIHLRVKTNKDHWESLTDSVKKHFGENLLDATWGYEGRQDTKSGGKSIANAPLLDFAGDYNGKKAKIIIICDQSNKNYRGTTFEELINISSDSAFLQEMRNKDILHTQFPKVLEDNNKLNLTLTMPDLSSLNDNVSSSLHFSYGCQMVCMNYQNMDKNMKIYFKKFNDAGHAYILKPENLRLMNAPQLKTPPKAPKELSFAPKTISTAMYTTSI
tara:strand:- start:1386 stop:2579 length:1194 start_codon:yes stop_codon:yes gene_type:complete